MIFPEWGAVAALGIAPSCHIRAHEGKPIFKTYPYRTDLPLHVLYNKIGFIWNIPWKGLNEED
jgi:hypothetical protein